jgi:hypothetical protein
MYKPCRCEQVQVEKDENKMRDELEGNSLYTKNSRIPTEF